jgi:hypothetical protein
MDSVDSMKTVLDQIALPPPICKFEGDAAEDSPLRVWLVSPAQYNKFAAQPGFRSFQSSAFARASQAKQHPLFLGDVVYGTDLLSEKCHVRFVSMQVTQLNIVLRMTVKLNQI